MEVASTTPTEPETLTPESVADISTDSPPVDTRKPDSYLDPVAEHLKGGALSAVQILAQVYGYEHADGEGIMALNRQMNADPRFHQVSNAGLPSNWDLVGLPPAEGKSIADCLAGNEAAANKLADPVVGFDPAVPGGDFSAVVSVPVAPVEGTGSETIASENPAPCGGKVPARISDPKDEEIRRLRRKLDAACDQLEAFHERQAEEKELTDAITKASRDVEAAKEVLAGKKTALATAHEQLFLHASGDTQTVHPDLREPDNDNEDDQGRPAPVVFASAPTIPEAQAQPVVEVVAPATNTGVTESQPAPSQFHSTLPDDQIVTDNGYLSEDLERIVMRDLAPSEKPHQIGPNVLEFRGCIWLIRDSSPDRRRWFAQRVLTKAEWQKLCESEFGMCVTGFDQSEEAKRNRTLGGDDCGRVVRVAKRLRVLGPEREGIVLVVDAPQVAPVEETDGKSAGAGDALRGEQDQFVAGDTPGGVVNSDPND